MVYTVTLNPALDKRIYLNEISFTDVNRVLKEKAFTGGKGINVSKILALLNFEAKTIALLGGKNGKLIEENLVKEGIDLIKIESSENTRENIELIDRNNSKSLRINSDTVVEDGIEDRIFEKINLIENESIVILSGSIPKNLNIDIYKKIILYLKKQGCVVFLDSDNLAFSKGIEVKPFLIKPNFEEFKRLIGRDIEENEIVKYLKKFEVENIIVSNGEKALYLKTDDKVYKFKSKPLKVESELGAGDSFLAGFTKSFYENKNVVEACKYGMAVAGAYISDKLNEEFIMEIYKEVCVEVLED